MFPTAFRDGVNLLDARLQFSTNIIHRRFPNQIKDLNLDCVRESESERERIDLTVICGLCVSLSALNNFDEICSFEFFMY